MTLKAIEKETMIPKSHMAENEGILTDAVQKIPSPFFVLNLPDGGQEKAKKIIGSWCAEKSFCLCFTL